jgi:hypothetical protein
MRQPAYGAKLLAARRAGRTPLTVHVVYAEDPYLTYRCNLFCNDHPELKLKPAEFEPGRFDWRALTGCLVEICDADGQYDTAPERFRPLVIEIGRLAGPVWINTPNHPPLAPQWLSWWPHEVEGINVKRREAWGRAFIAWCDGRWAEPARAA